jgi:hypothetical protein
LIPWELTSVAQTSNAVSVFEGMPIQLQSVASSVAPLSYQWRHAGLPISGETSDSIVLPLAGGNVGGNYSVVVSSTNGTIESVPTRINVLPLSVLGDALNATNLEWRMGGSRSWELESDAAWTHDGLLSARTPFLDNGEDCWIETSVQGPGVLSFWWRSSIYNPTNYNGEAAYAPTNYFQVLEDGVEKNGWSGDVGWTPDSLPIEAGNHTVRWAWSYPIRNAYWGGFNRVWIDDVGFTGVQPRITAPTMLPDGRFEFSILATPGANLGIEASSDLKSWLPIGQVSGGTNGVVNFTHETAANYGLHFYRVVVIF